MSAFAILSPAQWARLSPLLDEALALPAPERAGWLAALAPAHADLAPALADVLARADAAPDDFMRHPVRLRGSAPDAADDASTPRNGAQVGPYRLLREIGSGGMGSVWLAERTDGALRRRVALKLPRASWDARGLAERMARERDILAGLEHANIARLYDAGVDAQGRPYLAMEYVEGQPLRAYCDERGSSVRERLALFLQVTSAVAHAHARLAVHRDLKPSNILVTAEGQVRLLDFGIAKLLEGAQGGHDPDLTRGIGTALTPDYAAPEQLRGDPITVAVDVYALGVVLYELLAGARPPRREERAPGGDAALPPASSVAVDPARVRELRGDLDTILAKALATAPGDRYPTVDAFAADVRRCLAGERVHARPDTLGYRALRLLRRHRAPAAIAVLVVLAVLGGAAPVAAVMVALAVGAAAALWQAGNARREAARAADEARQAQRERDRAMALLEQNEAASTWMQVMLTETAAADERVTLHELLERSEKLALDSIGERPEQQAAVLDMIGSFHMTFGSYGKAETLLRQAGDLLRHSRDVTLRARVECNHALAVSELGNVELARRTIETWLAVPEVEPQVAALCQQYLAQIARNHQDAKGALANALAAEERARRAPHVMPGFAASLAGDIAYAYFLTGDMDEAETHFARAVAMLRAAGRGESPTAVAIRSNWALACAGVGDAQRALNLIDEVVAIVTRRTPGGTPPPYLVNNRASTLVTLGRYDEAAAECERSRRIAENAGAAVFVLNARVLQARIRMERGDVEGAAGEFAALEDAVAALPADSFAVLGMRQAAAMLALRRGDAAHAAATIEPVIAFYAARGTRTVMRANALRIRAEARWNAGDTAAAMEDAAAALALAEALRGRRTASVASGSCALLVARLAHARGDARAAQEARAHAVAQLTVALGERHPETLRAVVLPESVASA